jgi:hypothetical protein
MLQNLPIIKLCVKKIRLDIREEVAAISPTMLQQVTQNFQKRLGERVDNKGRHLTDAIFRK